MKRWLLRLKICQGFDQYANVRPTRILPGIDAPLKRCTPEDLNWVGALDRERMRRGLAAEAPLESVPALYDEADAADLPERTLVQVKQA